jgi:arylsulfatase A-like enzyme
VANGYVSDKFGFEQGWGVFRNYIRENRPSEAEHVFADALAWHADHVKQASARPFFLYVQSIDPHVTYRVEREYWSKYFEGEYRGPLGPSIDATDQVKLSTGKHAPSSADAAWLRALYWGEVDYHDTHLGHFLEELEARGELKDTLIVMTNDHGEELGERGRFGHGHQVFEEMIRAPLLVHYPPTFPAGKTVTDIVEHVDVAPTILDALGRDPLREADGQSLVPLVRDLPVRQPSYAVIEFLDGRRVLRVGGWKLFARAGGDAALFDLAADPHERHDVVATSPIARRLCEVHLGEGLATPDKATRMQGLGGKRRYRAGAADIDPQMRRQLEALGYFGAGPRPGSDDAKD